MIDERARSALRQAVEIPRLPGCRDATTVGEVVEERAQRRLEVKEVPGVRRRSHPPKSPATQGSGHRCR